ncbi:PREDICTED: probable 3-hydroxyisobutyrate dehydrogenase, mitochondrial [Papilio xuthus]|uniref:3-hydroxyisobutyrate dehydrogenase n=2 Tax=Papilio xuthus TaxID=66420 RepID=A0A194PJC7_PAPXU|nr:PREDICTED: probable 3-hydroxyisobutyrate dehydrogenase, mitochondrial [Papilio xuthus]KPI93143.1 3-hydroxyisobutyrate dehydrogenase, mitochondrial [Papilio xuthus]
MATGVSTRCLLTLSKRGFSSKADKNVAFLGLGNMGGYMAANLVKKGFNVRGYDPSKDALTAAAKNGISGANSIAAAVDGVDVVVSILPSNKVVLDAYLGKDGVVKHATKGALLIDSSTVDPNVPKQIFPVATENGVNFIDAPVSGGVMGAQNATLAFMAGGRKDDFTRSLPMLQAMGAKHFHCGDVGSGQVAKLTNNMLMGITGMATAECMNMGIKMGLDPQVLLDVLNNSSARSWSTEVYCPVPGLVPTAPSSRNYDGGFKNELMVKDLELASGMALGIRSPIPLGAVATQLYRIVQSRGYGQKDFSFVFQLLKEEAEKK